MRQAGHTGRHFYPSHFRTDPASIHAWKGMGDSKPGGDSEESPFVKWTIPAFEFRRLLEEMRARNESYALNYTKLPVSERLIASSSSLFLTGFHSRLESSPVFVHVLRGGLILCEIDDAAGGGG